jgi:hypothetical protein
MAGRTPRFGFLTFDNERDDLSSQNYKAFDADRVVMDRLLRIAVEEHHHNGVLTNEAMPAPPRLILDTGGTLPPNTPIYYRTALVDVHGQEHLASSTASVVTPIQIDAPDPPTMASTTAGILAPGDYQYAISAYTGDSVYETALSHTITGRLSTADHGWIITLPHPPSGADGFNLYRKGPTESGFNFLFSIDTYTPTWTDTGTTDRSPSRANPTVNTTSLHNTIRIFSSTDYFREGETLRVYRSFDAGNWDYSLIGWIAGWTTNVSGFVDTGQPPQPGYPPDVATGAGGAPKIDLRTETTGTLPPGLLTTATSIVFNLRGVVRQGTDVWQWVNDYERCWLLTARSNLAAGSVPDLQYLGIRIEVCRAGETTWNVFSSTTPNIPRRETIGWLATFPDHATDPPSELNPGDALRIAVTQNGGGAHTDRDLSVLVTAAVLHGPTDQTIAWSTP